MPQLGATDYTPFMQGSIRGSESVARGIEALGQAAAQGVQQYYQKKEEKQLLTDTRGRVKQILSSNPAFAQGLGISDLNDDKAVDAAIKGIGGGDIRKGAAVTNQMLIQLSQQEQQRQAAEQAAMPERVALQAASSLIAAGVQDPLAEMSRMRMTLTPNVVKYVSEQQAQAASTAKTRAEAESIGRPKVKSAVEQEKERLEVERLRAQLQRDLNEIDPNSVEAQRKQAELQKLQREEYQAGKKEEGAEATLQRRLEGERSRAQNVLTSIQQARIRVQNTPLVTGLSGKASALIPGTPAYEINEMLGTIKANIGFDRLQKMREESPTGGALGQVAVEELRALQNSIASLDLGQSPETLVSNLARIEEFYNKFIPAIESDIGLAGERAATAGKRVGRFVIQEVK